MLQLEIKTSEGFDEKDEEFVLSESFTLKLEHSLVSLSKWESKYNISFLGVKQFTTDQAHYYIRMMNLEGDFPEKIFNSFTADDYDNIRAYIDAKMTATTVPEQRDPPSGEPVTAELIYYWMISLDIPAECQFWHLDRLLTLIKLCNHKNKPKNARKKNVTQDVLAQRRAINEQRKQQLGSSG